MKRPKPLTGPISIIVSPSIRIGGDEDDDTVPEVTLAPEPELNEVHNANGAGDTSDLDEVDFSFLGGPDLGGLEDETQSEEKTAETPPENKKEPAETKEPSETPAKGDEAKTEESKAEDEITSEADIEAHQAKPNAPREVHTSIKGMKEKWKRDAAKARELTVKVKELEEKAKTAAPAVDEQGNPILPEAVKTRLEELERMEQSVLMEKSPVFQSKYDQPVKQAEDALFTFLKEHGLSDEIAGEIKAAGVDGWNKWKVLTDTFTDPLNAQEVLRLRQELRDKRRVKDTALDELKAGNSKLAEETQNQTQEEIKQWSTTAASVLQEHQAKHDWAKRKEVPADATEEVKKSIEDHNKAVEEVAATSRERVVKCYQRDPRILSETVFKSLMADRLETEVTRLKSELDTANQRAAELEERIGGARKAGQMSKADHAPRGDGSQKPKAKSYEEILDQSADEAFDAWEKGR